MKAQTEQQTKVLSTGGYIVRERTIKVLKGLKKVSAWRIIYDSRRGY